MTPLRSQSRASWIGRCLCLLALSTPTTGLTEPSDSELTTTAQTGQQDLLQRMDEAVRKRNYRGVMVYARNGQMQGLHVVHRYEDGREQERLHSLGDEPREIIRDNDIVTCILPKNRQVMLDRFDNQGVLANVRKFSLQEIEPYYDMVPLGQARLIDRQCQVYHIKPRDQYRYGYRVWVDKQTSLPLRLDLLGAQGEVLEQSMFTQIEFPESIPDEALRPTLDPVDYQWIRYDQVDSVPVRGESHWQMSELPPGFRLVDRGMRVPAEGDQPIEHLLYSDGLATVSVMLRPQRNKKLRFRGLSQMGAVNVYAQQVNGHHVTVMGEVPRATVEYFGRGVHALKTDASDTDAGSKNSDQPAGGTP